MRLRASGFPLGWRCCPNRGGQFDWQNVRWQHAIFLKVNNKTTAVSHLKRPRRPQGWEGSRWVHGARTALLQSSTFLAGTDQWFSFPQLASSSNHSWRGHGEEMGSVPTPTKLRRLLSGAPGFAWLISTARHPSPSICLSLSKQYQSHWRPAAQQAFRCRPQRTDSPCLFAPTGVCSEDHRGGCTEKLKEQLSPPSAPSRGSPKSFPEPHTRSAAGPRSWSPSPQGKGTLQESSLGKNKALTSDTQKGSFKCRKTLDDVKRAGLTGTCHVCKEPLHFPKEAYFLATTQNKPRPGSH